MRVASLHPNINSVHKWQNSRRIVAICPFVYTVACARSLRTQFAHAVRARRRCLGHARAIASFVAAAAEQPAHDLLGASPVVAGKCCDFLAQAQLVEVILEFAQAGTQLVDLALSLLCALLHV